MENIVKVKRKGEIVSFKYLWGDNIEIGREIKEGHYKVCGWKTLPDGGNIQVGDLLALPVSVDGVGYYVVNKCELIYDPKDMFFADIRFVIGTKKGAKKITDYQEIYDEVKDNDVFGVLGSMNPDGELLVESKPKEDMDQFTRSTREVYQYIVGYEKSHT